MDVDRLLFTHFLNRLLSSRFVVTFGSPDHFLGDVEAPEENFFVIESIADLLPYPLLAIFETFF